MFASDLNWLHFGLSGGVVASFVLALVFALHVILGMRDCCGGIWAKGVNGSLEQSSVSTHFLDMPNSLPIHRFHPRSNCWFDQHFHCPTYQKYSQRCDKYHLQHHKNIRSMLISFQFIVQIFHFSVQFQN